MTKTMSLSLLRNSIIVSLAALIMLSFAAFAYAEDGATVEADATVSAEAGANTGTPPKPKLLPRPILNNILQTRGEIKDDRQNLKDSRGDLKDARMNGSSTPEDMKGARQEVRDDARDLRQDRMKMGLRRAGLLAVAQIERMEKLILRIESRADKLDEKGVVTAEARVDLATATTELAGAKSDLESLKGSAAIILNSQTVAAATESVNTIKPIFDSLRAHLKAAHEAIRSSIKKLKDASVAAGLSTSAAVEQSDN